jgi:hypothetical protein
MLVQAQSELSALVASADARSQAALDDAITQLGDAFPYDGLQGIGSVSPLWADFGDANFPVPPPYGDAVFTSTEAAAMDLVSILSDPTVPQAALDRAGQAILAADQSIADNALAEAGLHSSEEDSQFGRGAPSEIAADESLWKSAYQHLGGQIDTEVTNLPQSTVDRAGEYLYETPIEGPAFAPTTATGPELTANEKPELFYFGAEGCPYCAVDRWSIVIALDQFGRFSPLSLNVSATNDDYAGTNTFTFYGSTYNSPYLSFVPVEGFTNQPPAGTNGACTGFPWSVLQPLSAEQQGLLAEYDPSCNVPFLDLANRWTTIGNYPDQQVIQNMSWQQIADALANPGSAVAQDIEGGAVDLIAQICTVTGEQPARTCDAPAVQQWQAGLP